jgi:hypothetical protein
MKKVIPENKARQGRWGTHALVILVASLILIAIGWAVAEFYGSAIEPAPELTQTYKG